MRADASYDEHAVPGGIGGKLTRRAYALTAAVLSVELPDRWAHCLGTYEQAVVLADRWVADRELVDMLTAAAIAHDVGYAAPAADAGHHAVDGARYLRRCGFCEEVVSLVAWHSTGEWEVPLIGVSLSAVAPVRPDPVLRDLLWIADFTTGPAGQRVSPSERIANIRDRYAPDSTPVQALDESAAEFDRVLARFEVSWCRVDGAVECGVVDAVEGYR